MVSLLRVATAGSVDDGKSTLIGRLLYDSKNVYVDQLDAVRKASSRTEQQRSNAAADLALLTDGLRAEREQGITIDVAYRYFATARRSFVLADSPGHVQYTRNMVTGASTADVAIVLADVRAGIIEQTKSHLAIAILLRVPHIILAVNKMDLVDYREADYRLVRQRFADAVIALSHEFDSDLPVVTAIPMSALHGDNVVHRAATMSWYTGPSLLEQLEEVSLPETAHQALRFPVQLVLRGDRRRYAGRVVAGSIALSDEIAVLPAGQRATVTAIYTADEVLDRAETGRCVAIELDSALDIARGDMLVAAASPPQLRREVNARVCVLQPMRIQRGTRMRFRSGTSEVIAAVEHIHGRLNTTEFSQDATQSLTANDLGKISLRLAAPLPLDQYSAIRATGCFLLADEVTGATVAAGMVAD